MSTLFDPKNVETIKNRISSLSPTSQAEWGKMNVNQMMCHVTDGFKMATGERPIADRSNLFTRTLLKFVVVKLIKMPKDAPTAPGLDQTKEGTKPGEFEDDRRNLIDALDRVTTMPPDHAWAAHPIFGRMSANDWAILGYKHIDHHLKQFGA
jgi:Protein of unknown function (DUF1569)